MKLGLLFVISILFISFQLGSDNVKGSHRFDLAAVLDDDFFNRKLHEGKLAIRFFNLQSKEKSGDSALISTPDGKHVLIDAGVPEAGPQIDRLLDRLDIKRLDAVFATHPHIDHIGGFTTLLYTRPVGTFYHSPLTHTTVTYKKVERAIAEAEVPKQALTAGDIVSIGQHVRIEVLNPPEGTTPGSLDRWGIEQLNNHSLVLKLQYGNTSFLFTGDIYKKQENLLVEQFGDRLNSTGTDAPHHGDMTSSSEAFVRAIQPEIAVFSANTLQSPEVLHMYQEEGIDVYVTGIYGHVLLISDGDRMQVHQQNMVEVNG